jgi:hypothetical protein
MLSLGRRTLDVDEFMTAMGLSLDGSIEEKLEGSSRAALSSCSRVHHCVCGLTTTLLPFVGQVSFNVFDVDGDGELSRAEVERMLVTALISSLRVSGIGNPNMRKLAEIATVVAQEVFNKFDADQVRPQDLHFFALLDLSMLM